MIFALDPLFDDFSWGTPLVIVVAKVLIVFALLTVAVMVMIWFERKQIAMMQNRMGPTVAGPKGLLQTLADGVKLTFKEDLIPDKADRIVFKLAPYLAVVPAFLTFTIVPIGGNFRDKAGVVKIAGHHTFLQVVDPPIGLLFFLAMSSVAVYGVMLAGWSSGSKYPLLGAVRASAQMVSYEAALGLAAAAVFLKSRSLSTHDIVAGQWDLADWNVIATAFVPFVIFLIAGTAELNRPPFDLVEAEQELVGGFHTEYSAMRFAMFFIAEFMNVITMSAIMVTLFFGGPSGFLFGPGWLKAILPTFWFMAKLFCFLFAFVWFRGTLPRLRYDQLMNLGWKILIPLALFWFVMLGAMEVADDNGWSRFAVLPIALAVLFGGTALLLGANRTARSLRDREEVTV